MSPRRSPQPVKGGPLKFSGTISMAWADGAIVSAPGER
jgi:hypothetical protein